MQAEYATDIVFKQRQDLAAFYPTLLETLIHAVKPQDIAMFLGKNHAVWLDGLVVRFRRC